MANESAAVAKDAARAALDLSMTYTKEVSASVTKEVYSLFLKIDSRNALLLAFGAGVMTLGAFYIQYRSELERATKKVLESTDETGKYVRKVDDITEGSIRVKLSFYTQQDVLQFLKDLKEKEIKLRLEEEFKEIGFNYELEVTIVCAKVIFQREYATRSVLDPQEDVKAEVEEVDLDPLKLMEDPLKEMEDARKRGEDPSKLMGEKEKRNYPAVLTDERNIHYRQEKSLEEKERKLKEKEKKLEGKERKLKEKEKKKEKEWEDKENSLEEKERKLKEKEKEKEKEWEDKENRLAEKERKLNEKLKGARNWPKEKSESQEENRK